MQLDLSDSDPQPHSLNAPVFKLSQLLSGKGLKSELIVSICAKCGYSANNAAAQSNADSYHNGNFAPISADKCTQDCPVFFCVTGCKPCTRSHLWAPFCIYKDTTFFCVSRTRARSHQHDAHRDHHGCLDKSQMDYQRFQLRPHPDCKQPLHP